ncbi:hypothetical protein Tco_0394111 [Tanacetum coccineum]
MWHNLQNAETKHEVESVANTFPDNVENAQEVAQVEPSPLAPERTKAVAEPVEETMVDAPSPAEEAPATQVPVGIETKVAEEHHFRFSL